MTCRAHRSQPLALRGPGPEIEIGRRLQRERDVPGMVSAADRRTRGENVWRQGWSISLGGKEGASRMGKTSSRVLRIIGLAIALLAAVESAAESHDGGQKATESHDGGQKATESHDGGQKAADLVLSGGAIYTLDAARTWAQAVAIRGGRLVYVGTNDGAKTCVGPETRVIELGGRFVMPAFQDAHVHPVGAGVELGLCDLNGAKTVDELRERIVKYAADHPDRPWITGGGWDLPLFPAANPKKEMLDALVSDRPVLLVAADGHSSWANSKALELAGVTAATPDPPSGRIERDPATGQPSGTLRESATDLVARLVPPATAGDRVEGLKRAVELAHRVGLTGVFEASADAKALDAYRDLDRAGGLNLHVAVAQYVDPHAPLAPQVEALAARRAQDWGPHVRLTSAKLFVDGVIESGTAALLEPYVGRDGSRGELIWSEPRLTEAAVTLDRAGLQLHVHAIGDRAIRATLDAVEGAEKANGARDRRPTLAHIQLFDPADVPRFRALGVIASFQPLWAYADAYIVDLTEPQLGPTRSRWLYPIASVAATGAVLACGSDWSVSSLAPLEGIEVALTRRNPDEPPGPGWIPEERVDLRTMLAAYTIGPAYAAFREADTGSLEVGKSADLVVLDHNLFEVPSHQVSETKVLLTLFEGREVWRDPSAPFDRLRANGKPAGGACN